MHRESGVGLFDGLLNGACVTYHFCDADDDDLVVGRVCRQNRRGGVLVGREVV